MITADYARTLSRYNAWQNRNLYAAADGLDDAARREDRGAFFRSIHGTLGHLLWGDTVWMSRFDGWQKPDVGIPGSPHWISEWPELCRRRGEADTRIAGWAATLTDADIEGDLAWHSGALGRDVTMPKPLCIAHFFNHQTHHRGQVHAMLTAAGARPGDTDLFAIPSEA